MIAQAMVKGKGPPKTEILALPPFLRKMHRTGRSWGSGVGVSQFGRYLFGGTQKGVFQRVVLADVPPGTKTGTRVRSQNLKIPNQTIFFV